MRVIHEVVVESEDGEELADDGLHGNKTIIISTYTTIVIYHCYLHVKELFKITIIKASSLLFLFT